MDFHQNQPDGEVNGHCLTFGWNEEYEGNQAECSWGVFDRFVKQQCCRVEQNYIAVRNLVNDFLQQIKSRTVLFTKI